MKADGPLPSRVRRRLPAATPAICAQVAQAGGGFLVQVLAARELGADGFAVFAFLYGAMIMATALTSGLIGDSLTVLDRHDPEVRAALFRLGMLTIVLAAVVGYAVGALTDLGHTGSVLFALATATYMLADIARRILMSCLRFWNLVLIDAAGLVTAIVVIGIVITTGGGIDGFLAGIVVWQVVVVVLATVCLPTAERVLPPRRSGALAIVLRFGIWRALQQFVRPTMLNAGRWIVLIAAGQAAVGQLEAARVYVAPAMLLVQGVGSYLLASYAADEHRPTQDLLARADRAAGGLLLSSTAAAILAAAAIPLIGPLITAGAFELSVVAVIGWAVYAASCAAVLPYGTLAAVRRRQGAVLGLRIADSVFSLALVGVVVWVLNANPSWTPMLLSVGSFIGGALSRLLLLRPLVRAELPAGKPS